MVDVDLVLRRCCWEAVGLMTFMTELVRYAVVLRLLLTLCYPTQTVCHFLNYNLILSVSS